MELAADRPTMGLEREPALLLKMGSKSAEDRRGESELVVAELGPPTELAQEDVPVYALEQRLQPVELVLAELQHDTVLAESAQQL